MGLACGIALRAVFRSDDRYVLKAAKLRYARVFAKRSLYPQGHEDTEGGLIDRISGYMRPMLTAMRSLHQKLNRAFIVYDWYVVLGRVP